MMIAADQDETALARAEPLTTCQLNGLPLLADRAHGELSAWVHAVTLERAVPFFGGPVVLRCAF